MARRPSFVSSEWEVTRGPNSEYLWSIRRRLEPKVPASAWETLRRIKTADEAVAFIKKFDWWTGTEWDLLMDLPAEEADAYLRLRGIVALADSVQQQRHLGRIEKGLPPEVEVDPLTMKEISSDVFDEDREAYGDPGGDSE